MQIFDVYCHQLEIILSVGIIFSKSFFSIRNRQQTIQFCNVTKLKHPIKYWEKLLAMHSSTPDKKPPATET